MLRHSAAADGRRALISDSDPAYFKWFLKRRN